MSEAGAGAAPAAAPSGNTGGNTGGSGGAPAAAPSAPSQGANLSGATASRGAAQQGSQPQRAVRAGVGAAQSGGEEQAAPQAGGEEQAAAAKRQLKILGQMREIDPRQYQAARDLLGIEDDSELESLIALRRGGHQRLEEARTRLEKAERFAELLRDERQAMAALERLHGPEKMRAWAEQVVLGRMQEAQMSPQERELRQREAEWSQRERELREREQRIEQERARAAQERHEREFSRAASEAIKAAKLPRTERVAEAMYAHAALMHKRTGTIDWSDVARDVRHELDADWRGMLEAMGEDGLEAWLGEERVRSLARRHGERVMASQAPRALPKAAKPSTPKPPADRPVSVKQYFRNLPGRR